MIKMEYLDDQIVDQMKKAIDIFPDRAEPHYTMGKYFNDKSRCDIGYTYFKNAKKIKESDALTTWAQFNAYFIFQKVRDSHD